MSKQTINIGASPNDGTGTPLRTSFDYTNQNFTELYTAVGPSGNNIVVPGTATITGALTLSAGTVNGVGYLNASKVLTAGSALVFDGTNLGIGGTGQLRFATSGGAIGDNSIGTENSFSMMLRCGRGSTSNIELASDKLVFSTSASERYKIDSTGIATWSNVGGVAGTAMTLNSTGLGIGVTPSAWNSGYKAVELASNVGAWSATTGINDFSLNSFFNASSQWIYKTTATAALYRQQTGQHIWYNAPSGTAGNAITFTQAMTLDASGNLLVGATTNTNVSRIFSRGTATSSALALQGASGDVALAQLTVGKFDNNTTTSQIFVRFTINDNSGGSGQINANGASQAAFGTFSDSRLKENILSLPSQLANILSLRPVEFDYKDGSGHQIGFVAQEMQEVYSDAVGEQNGFLTVTGWSKTEARLVSAIKELAAKVQVLEAKLA